MRHHGSVALALALLGTTILAGTARAATVGPVTVFGDSYSTKSHTSTLNSAYYNYNWPKLLQNDGKVTFADDYAVGGTYATSAINGTKVSRSFAAEINKWTAAGKPLGDTTFVYLGYNDIADPSVTTYSPSYSGYYKGVSSLLTAGANANGKQLLLVMPHNVGSTPRFNGNATTAQTYDDRTRKFNTNVVAKTANAKGLTAIDLYTVVQKVLADPAAYGFKNVRTADPANAGTVKDPNPGPDRAALYIDDLHMGQKGQKIIEQTIAGYLTRAQVYAQGLQQTQKTTTQRQADLQTGQALAFAALPEEARLGLVAFPIGPAALPEAEPAAGDVTRAGFDEAYDPDRQDGGVGFTYGLADGTEVGVAFTNYGESGRDTVKQEVTGTALASQGVSLSLRHKLGAFALETRLDYGQDRYQALRYDGITDSHDRAAFDGRTFDLAQRVGYPLQHEGYVLTPWAELSYQSQEVDGFTLKSPFTSDQRYAGATVSDTLGRVGLDAKLDPIAVGEQGWLTLWGGVSYTQGLAQDDYRVRIKEAAFGNTQETVIDRPTAQTLGLTLGASLALGENLALDGDLALDQDLQTGPAGAARLALAYRF